MSTLFISIKKFLPALVASAMAALIGAGVGGWITSDIVTQDTRIKMVANSYSTFLTEATRALSTANDRDLTEEELDRFHRATAVLRLTASKKVRCRALIFLANLGSDDDNQKYIDLASEMRNELMGKEGAISLLDNEC